MSHKREDGMIVSNWVSPDGLPGFVFNPVKDEYVYWHPEYRKRLCASLKDAAQKIALDLAQLGTMQ
jgi:hypothetical protein